MNGRPNYRAAFFLDEADQVVVSEVRGSAEQAWVLSFGKSRVGICEDRGEKEATVYMDKNRLVVGDKFGKQRHQKQRKKNPQRPVTATISLKVFPAALVDGRYLYPAALHGCVRRARRFRLDSRARVHVRPLASRSRCAGRSTCRSNRKSDSRPHRSARIYKAWRRRRDSLD